MFGFTILGFILLDFDSKINEFSLLLSNRLASNSNSDIEFWSGSFTVGSEVSELSLILVLAVRKDIFSEIPVWLGSVCDNVCLSVIELINELVNLD